MKQVTRVFGVLLFVSLMLLKVSALHVYSHQDDKGDTIENCQICNILAENQTAEVPLASTSDFTAVLIPTITIEVVYEQPVFKRQQHTLHCISRPPPTGSV
ncbi:hypothetical protein GTQ34_03840 [Muricauda sp. JGD-17]|uniref:Uncharacterized protein n=1 Tax=Flagellimonas ochracea TaxID=2696472 RepID=A0A964WWQ8_9FLAO|nr:hypothetical protein [Allomuricauda ochracea]NAY91042.1 hypothetical protein [Allomuricauda ochracea]